MTLLDVQHVTVAFGSTVVLDDVSLRVEQGETVGLIGPNGAGKTTLFRAIAGEIVPVRGSILLNGTKLPNRDDARSRAGLARTFQSVQLFEGLTVLDHLVVSLQAHERRLGPLRDLRAAGRSTPGELFRCRQTLELCGIGELGNEVASTLSLGQRRSVELARALVSGPSLLLTDEPSSGLDGNEVRDLISLLRRVQHETNLAIVIVEHDLATVKALANRVLALSAGRLVAAGSFDAVIATPEVREGWSGVPS